MPNLTDQERQHTQSLAVGLAEMRDRQAERFEFYRPYDAQRRFHSVGIWARERLLMAGNQVGKTTCGAAELAIHLTGRYPDWWDGRRFDRPIVAWAAGVSAEATAAAMQSRLLGGMPGQTGMLPAHLIQRLVRRGQGVVDRLEGLTVRHRSQMGDSVLSFKSYAQGRESWQGASVDLLWFDEEPGFDIYLEGLSRTNATLGMVYTTFTPLKGRSRVVERFLDEPSDHRTTIQIGLNDAAHLSDAQRQKILDSYPAFEREARAQGIPSFGSGRVFPVDQDSIRVVPFDVPGHWPRLAAIDFGWEHPTAAVEVAWDRDLDVLYVVRAYRAKHRTPKRHCEVLCEWGAHLLWVWPHDGLAHEKGTGIALADQYRRHGLKMYRRQVTFENGSNAVEPGINLMLERFESGRMKVFAPLTEWFEEFNLYHRIEGRIHNVRDDLMSATRYAVMGLRFAVKSPAIARYDEETIMSSESRFDPLSWGEEA